METSQRSARPRSGGLAPSQNWLLRRAAPPLVPLSLKPAVQAKLSISQPGDTYELEADRVAERIMRMPDTTVRLQRKCACDVSEEEHAGMQLDVQRLSASHAEAGEAAPPIVSDGLNRPGEPLDESTRAFMEPSFGQDFSDVRIHSDARAAESARAVGALAYTVGRDVGLAEGTYAPGTDGGRYLLAHELAHVLQQRAGGTRLQRQPRTTTGQAVPPTVTTAPECPPRPAGEREQSRTTGFLADNVVFNRSAREVLVQDFEVSRAALPPDVTNHAEWQRAMSVIAGYPIVDVIMVGYTDCVGINSENLSLRNSRAQSVTDAMPPMVRARVVMSFPTSPSLTFLASNATPVGRAQNRAVRVIYRPTATVSGRNTCDLLRRATTFDQYLFLVTCLEERLGLTSPANNLTMLSLLRQLYYGTVEWPGVPTPADPNEPRRSVNPLWGRVIPDMPWSPGTDPTPRAGRQLIEALSLSQEITAPAAAGGGGVERSDIGHLLTGMDAMLNPQQPPLPLITQTLINEEWATWAGDVGNAAASWALDQHYRTPRGDFDFYFREVAYEADLVGDLDSFAFRTGLRSGVAAPALLGQRITLTGRFSEILRDYYSVPATPLGQARANRYRNFVTAYGGIISGNSITNHAALVARLQPSVQQFAWMFSAFEMLFRPRALPPRPPGSPDAGLPLATGVNEMTERFVRWLESKL